MNELRRSLYESGKRRAESQERGFTILEVLAVIAVLGLLAAMLLPVFSGAMDEAKQTKCMSNLRQLGVALNAYVAENGEYPLYKENRHGGRGAELWQEKIMDVNSPEEPEESKGKVFDGIFKCPSVKVPEIFRRYSMGYLSYGYNAFGLGGHDVDEPLGLGGTGKGERTGVSADWLPPAVQSGSVMKPSSMAAMGPGVRGCAAGIVDGHAVIARAHMMAHRNPYPGLHDAAWERMSNRHDGEANLVFVDGHVESIPLATLMRGKSDRALSMWNRDGKPHRGRLCH